MPRTARYKKENAIYHVMSRSISEVILFKDDSDKNRYMELIKKYKQIYGFKLYAYCLMGNHIHLMIDANGADISKVMHGLNLSYARYYNKKYRRHGHLFQDRFKSKIITDKRYLKFLSLYIHNNPREFNQFKNQPDKYRFSSLGIYIGNKKDEFNIVDSEIVLSMFGHTPKEAMENYYRIIFKKEYCDSSKINFENEKTEYRSYRNPIIRSLNHDKIIDYVFRGFEVDNLKLHLKYDRSASKAKAISVLLMKKFGDMRDREIAHVIGGVTQARISQLCKDGVKLMSEDEKSSEIVKGLLDNYK